EWRFEGDLLGAVLKLDLRDQADARSDGREDEDVEPAEFHRKAIRYPVLDEIVRVAFYVAADGRARQCADERASVKRILYGRRIRGARRCRIATFAYAREILCCGRQGDRQHEAEDYDEHLRSH